jgi:hypothetical protein
MARNYLFEGLISGDDYLVDSNADQDVGDSTNRIRTVYLSNTGGRIIDCQDATTTSGPTVYTVWAGGGSGSAGTPAGGTLLVDFNSVILGTNSENQYVIDFGQVDFASAVHHYVFRSTGNIALLGDISVSTEFGGALGPGNIGFKFENTGTFNYRTTIDSAMGETFSAGYDPQAGDRWRKTLSLYQDGLLQYEFNYSTAGWHGFEMNPSALSPTGSNYSMVYIDSMDDRLSANRNSRHGLRVVAPTTDLNGFTLNYAANIAIIGQPTVGTYNAGIYLGNSAKIVLANTNNGNGPSMWGIVFGADILVNEPITANSAYWHLVLPSGTSTNADYRCYNQSNILGGAYAYFTHGVSGTTANVIVSETGAAANPITELDIGSDATATSFTTIDFLVQGVSEYSMTAAALTIGDANNIVLGAGTGTQFATAAAQKLAFYGNAPVIQQSSTGQTAGSTVGVGNNVNDDSTFTGGAAGGAYTIGDIVKHLKTYGLLA